MNCMRVKLESFELRKAARFDRKAKELADAYIESQQKRSKQGIM